MRKIWIAAVILTVMLMGSGCAKEALEEDIAEVEEENKAELWTEEDEQELYNLYVQINNEMIGQVGDAIGEYFYHVEYQEEFSVLDDAYTCFLVSDSFFGNLDRAEELLERKEEHLEVDKAYLALSPVARELGKALNEIYEYTDEKTFLEDDFVKGKELHKKFFAYCTEYETLGTTFVEELQELADKRREENLAKIKEDGYEISAALIQMIATAQEIQEEIFKQGIEEDAKLLELDTEALKPLCDRYREEIATVNAYLKDSEALEKEGLPTSSVSYKTFQEEAKNSLKELDAIFENVAQQKQPSTYEASNQFTIEGTLTGFYSKVSRMVDDYNQIIK